MRRVLAPAGALAAPLVPGPLLPCPLRKLPLPFVGFALSYSLFTLSHRAWQASLAMFSGGAAAGPPAGSAERAASSAGGRSGGCDGGGAGAEQREAGAVAAHEQGVQVRGARRAPRAGLLITLMLYEALPSTCVGPFSAQPTASDS